MSTFNSQPYGSGSDTWAANTLRWRSGDRVAHINEGVFGRVSKPPRDPAGHETNYVWVAWDDGTGSFVDPAWIERAQ